MLIGTCLMMKAAHFGALPCCFWVSFSAHSPDVPVIAGLNLPGCTPIPCHCFPFSITVFSGLLVGDESQQISQTLRHEISATILATRSKYSISPARRRHNAKKNTDLGTA
jgi:hypothetical protein